MSRNIDTLAQKTRTREKNFQRNRWGSPWRGNKGRRGEPRGEIVQTNPLTAVKWWRLPHFSSLETQTCWKCLREGPRSKKKPWKVDRVDFPDFDDEFASVSHRLMRSNRDFEWWTDVTMDTLEFLATIGWNKPFPPGHISQFCTIFLKVCGELFLHGWVKDWVLVMWGGGKPDCEAWSELLVTWGHPERLGIDMTIFGGLARQFWGDLSANG